MSQQPKQIHFEDFAHNPATLFTAIAATKEPLLVEKDGVVFRVQIDEQSKPEDIWAAYDAQLARAGLKRSAGTLSGVDAKELIADIHKARQQDSIGRPT